LPSRAKYAAQPLITSLLIIALAVVPGLVGCGSKAADAPPTIEPAQPAESPPAALPPTGAVLPLPGRPAAALYDPGTATLVVLVPGVTPQVPGTLTVFAGDRNPPRPISLPGPATALVGDGRGRAYLAARGGYFVVDLTAGSAGRIDISGQEHTDFTAIARRDDGKLVLGSADGAVYILASETAVGSRTKIFAHVDSIVTQGNTTVVLDRGQTSVTSVDADGRAEAALRAGEGATTMTIDPAGRVLVADTRGDELLVFGVDPLILRQRYPVRGAPYGLAGSRRLAWVSRTADNAVVGYDLATGIPVEKVRYPTVQQPNILAFDDAADTLYVISGSGGGVQVIEHADVPR
jgi:DNA-binding beta-propeller fold protein YncE